MKNLIKKINTIIMPILVIALILLMPFGCTYYNGIHSPFAQKVKRNTFEQTKSYNQGRIQDLAKIKLEYELAETQENKDALKAYISVSFADFDSNNIENYQLKEFLIKMRGY